MTKEAIINRIMKECEADGEPVTRKEAEEMAEMEIGASEQKRYEKSNKPRKTSAKERKVDETKKLLLNACRIVFEGYGAKTLSMKTETELLFNFEGVEYTLKLIKHRPPKD